MKRDELRSIITDVCDRTNITGPEREKLIGSAEKIDRVATGQFEVRDDEGASCGCPALVAGIYKYVDGDIVFAGNPHGLSSLFPGAFDSIIWENFWDEVVPVDYDVGYIPVED